MILPGKHLRQDRALLSIGAEILEQLGEERTISELWERVRETHGNAPNSTPLPFDWFVLSLCFLYAASALDLHGGLIRRGANP